jgi:hypothetical protein
VDENAQVPINIVCTVFPANAVTAVQTKRLSRLGTCAFVSNFQRSFCESAARRSYAFSHSWENSTPAGEHIREEHAQHVQGWPMFINAFYRNTTPKWRTMAALGPLVSSRECMTVDRSFLDTMLHIVPVCRGLCWIGYRLMKETGVCRMEYLGEVRTATDPAFVQLSSTNDVALLVHRERETAERETGL